MKYNTYLFSAIIYPLPISFFVYVTDVVDNL